jgi:hypothetical protein
VRVEAEERAKNAVEEAGLRAEELRRKLAGAVKKGKAAMAEKERLEAEAKGLRAGLEKAQAEAEAGAEAGAAKVRGAGAEIMQRVCSLYRDYAH